VADSSARARRPASSFAVAQMLDDRTSPVMAALVTAEVQAIAEV
jgi:hypothetical protein